MIRPMSLWPRSGRAQLLKRLRAALPRGALLHAAEDIKPYECDGLTMYRQLPLAVALPEDEAQARAVLRACHELRVPVVARGAGTGLSGGALPIASGVLLSLSKFNRILHFDPLARIARVQPRVRALTIEGGVMELGSEAPDAPGCDLLALITGSEGMLAVITEVTVRLLPSPAAAQVIMAAFADVGRAGQAVADIIAAGLIPAGLEMMDQTSIEAVEPYAQAGYPLDAQAILLCEADGAAEDVAEQIAQMSAILKDGGATTLRVSSSEAERLRLCAGRKAAFPAVGRLAPDYYCVDGTIPRKSLPHVLRSIAQMEKKYGLRCANVFHAGDGNLHPIILYDANRPEQTQKAEQFGAEILELSVAVGGTVTGEHGVGVEKLNQMCVQFGSDELEIMHAVKAAFDEHGLLNPGKAVPTLHRCAEYGRMHVHGGALSFPDLPRF